MSETYLSQSEIIALTGKIRPTAQIKRLAKMNIHAVPGGDGKLRVLRAHHDAVMSGTTYKVEVNSEPDWSALT